MPDLIIKPKAGSGNKVILKDQGGGAVLTTADLGATIANATLTTPTIASMANCTFPDDHILYFKHTVLAASGGSHTSTAYSTHGGVAVTVPAVTCNSVDNLTIIFNTYVYIAPGSNHCDIGIRGDRSAPSAINYQAQTLGADDETASAHRLQATYVIYDDALSNADHTYRLQSQKGWGGAGDAGNISINSYGVNILVIGKK